MTFGNDYEHLYFMQHWICQECDERKHCSGCEDFFRLMHLMSECEDISKYYRLLIKS